MWLPLLEWTVEAVEVIESRLGEGVQGRPMHTVLVSFPLGFAGLP